MGLHEQFNTVAESVRKWKTTPENDVNLELYSLYKQAVSGDVNILEPSGLVENAKWKAWSSRKGLSQQQAKQQYIDLANKYQAKYS